MRDKTLKIWHVCSHWGTCDRMTLMAENGRALVEIHFPKASAELGYIWNLWVDGSHRRKGLGRRLLRTAEEYVAKRGCKVAELEWDKRDTPLWTLEWYIAQGYEPVRTNMDITLLRKELK